MLLQQRLMLEEPKVVDIDNEDASSTSTAKILKSHVSRVAITNSREDLSQHTEYINPSSEDTVDIDATNRKKTVTKINIVGNANQQGQEVFEQQKATAAPTVPAKKSAQVSNQLSSSIQPEKKTRAIIEGASASSPTIITNTETGVTPKGKSPPKKPARAKTSQSVENITAISDDTQFDDTVNSGLLTPKSNTINAPRTPSSKPRAGRKRWAFNFGGSKTGSLKSLKSLKSTGGDDDDNDSTSKK